MAQAIMCYGAKVSFVVDCLRSNYSDISSDTSEAAQVLLLMMICLTTNRRSIGDLEKPTSDPDCKAICGFRNLVLSNFTHAC